MHRVEQIDYHGLVSRMARAGLDGMADVLTRNLGELGRLETKNTVKFFWAALFNAAKAETAVWLWLCTAPHVRRFAPTAAQFHTMPQFVEDITLPVIGGPDDEPYQPSEPPRQYPAEPTEKNFREQAAALDEHLRAEGEKNPDNRCQTIQDYVETFYYSGTGQMMAQVQLTENGFHALATRKGIDYLMATYPPQG